VIRSLVFDSRGWGEEPAANKGGAGVLPASAEDKADSAGVTTEDFLLPNAKSV